MTDEERYEEAVAGYDDNADWFEDGSVVKAKAFITACTRLIRILPRLSEHQNERIEFDNRILAGERNNAQLWVNANEQTDFESSSVSSSGAVHYRMDGYWDE